MLSRITILIFVFSLLPLATAFGQAPDTLWTQIYGGYWEDFSRSIQKTSDNGFIIPGYTNSFGATTDEVYLVKTDSMGNMEWQATLGNSVDDEWGEEAQQTSDGGYIIAGFSRNFGVANYNGYIVKTDDAGNMEWDKTLGGAGHDKFFSVQQTSDGGYIFAGYTESTAAGDEDVYLVKTDNLGNMEWETTFGASNYDDQGRSIHITSDGGYFIAGYSKVLSNDYDIYVVKTDSAGNLEWDAFYGGTDWEDCHEAQQTSDGGYIIIASSRSFGSGNYDFYLVKTDSLGNVEWDAVYGTNDIEFGVSVQQTMDSGYILGGHKWFLISGAIHLYIIKTDDAGNMEWDAIYEYGGTVLLNLTQTVLQDSDGGYIIVGNTYALGMEHPNIRLVKTLPPVGIHEEPVSMLCNVLVSSVSPNPCSDFLSVSYTLPAAGHVNISVFNLLGQRIEELVDESKPAGEHTVTWNGASMLSEETLNGMYFINITSGNQQTVEKFVLFR